MIQIKSFPITEAEKANTWLEENYGLVITSKDGPEIKVFGHTNPMITILFDKHGQNSSEYKKEALTVELSILNQQLFEYQRQYLSHRAERDLFPEWNETKGKHAPQKNPTWINHDQGMVTTSNQILLQKAKIKIVEQLLANPDSINESSKKKSETK